MVMGLHIQNFNQRIRALNQSNGKELVMGAKEAKELHTEIFQLLIEFADLEKRLLDLEKSAPQIALDGGGFK
jgi:hypothetical protein